MPSTLLRYHLNGLVLWEVSPSPHQLSPMDMKQHKEQVPIQNAKREHVKNFTSLYATQPYIVVTTLAVVMRGAPHKNFTSLYATQPYIVVTTLAVVMRGRSS